MKGSQELTALGWTLLLGSWTAITIAVIYCFYRVLGGKTNDEEEQ